MFQTAKFVTNNNTAWIALYSKIPYRVYILFQFQNLPQESSGTQEKIFIFCCDAVWVKRVSYLLNIIISSTIIITNICYPYYMFLYIKKASLSDLKNPLTLRSSSQIDFDKWTHEEDLSDEARDINDDFPGLYEKMQAEELGWPSKRECGQVKVWGKGRSQW